jgi:hypothetical protein
MRKRAIKCKSWTLTLSWFQQTKCQKDFL